jgi:hypothetical protein
MSTRKKSIAKKTDSVDMKRCYGVGRKMECTAVGHDSGTYLDRLETCVREIKSIRMDYEFTGEDESDVPQDTMTPDRPWNERHPERRSLRHRHIERRRHLLGHALTDILEAMSNEIGTDAVESVFYPERYIPAESFGHAALEISSTQNVFSSRKEPLDD